MSGVPDRLLASRGFFGGGPEDAGGDFDDVLMEAAEKHLHEDKYLAAPWDEEDAVAPDTTLRIAQSQLVRLPPKLPGKCVGCLCGPNASSTLHPALSATDVDAHISRDELRYANLQSALRLARGVARPDKGAVVRRGSAESSNSPGSVFGGFSVGEIRRLVNYVDSLNTHGA